MALPIITIDDFKGVLSLSANTFKVIEIDSYINTYLNEYTRRLLSTEVYEILGTSNDVKWTLLIDGGTYFYLDCEGKKRKSSIAGFTNFLKFIIYFHIVRDDFTMTDVGAVNNKNENSERVRQYPIAQDRYNKSIGYWKEILTMIERTTNYIQPITSIVDNLDNTSTVTVTTLQETLVANGDTILINDVEYVVSGKNFDGIDTETILINSGGVTGDEYIFSPYELVKTEAGEELEYSFL